MPTAKKKPATKKKAATKKRAAKKRTTKKRATKKKRTTDPGAAARHRQFVSELIKNNMNQSLAYKAVYGDVTDKTARTNGSKLLTHTDVLPLVQRRLAEMTAKMEVDEDSVLRAWVHMADANVMDYYDVEMEGDQLVMNLKNLKELPKHIQQNIREIEVETAKTKNGTAQRVKLKLVSREKSVEMLARYMNMLIERKQVEVINYADVIREGMSRIEKLGAEEAELIS